jgi:hypothetical protein
VLAGVAAVAATNKKFTSLQANVVGREPDGFGNEAFVTRQL